MSTTSTKSLLKAAADKDAAKADTKRVPGVSIPIDLPPDEDIYGAKYHIRIAFRDRVCGGTPKDPDVQLKWLETRGFSPQESEEYVKNMRAEAESSEDYVNEEVQKSWNGFKSDAEGIYLEARQLEAMLREGATELEITKKTRGFRQRLQHGCFIRPPRLRLLKGGHVLTEAEGAVDEKPTPTRVADGSQMKVVHAITPKGKIAAFSRFDYVTEAQVEFDVLIVQGGEKQMFTAAPLARIIALNQEQGLGANRSQGEGKFDVLSIEKIW